MIALNHLYVCLENIVCLFYFYSITQINDIVEVLMYIQILTTTSDKIKFRQKYVYEKEKIHFTTDVSDF